jgi:hypothetical protein
MYRICWIVEKYPARFMVLLSKYILFRPHKFKVNPLNGDVPSMPDAPHFIILLVSGRVLPLNGLTRQYAHAPY